MRALAAVFLLSYLGAPAFGAAPAGIAAEHPILGIWRLDVPDTGCTETYHFRADGTTFVTSAAEVSESVYTIAAQPDKQGFYRLADRITKDNGKPDCSGNVMKPGAQVINFIQFHPSRTLFLMCADQAMQACIGPFRRVRGVEV